jgi:hypothetical protein
VERAYCSGALYLWWSFLSDRSSRDFYYCYPLPASDDLWLQRTKAIGLLQHQMRRVLISTIINTKHTHTIAAGKLNSTCRAASMHTAGMQDATVGQLDSEGRFQELRMEIKKQAP